MTLMVTLAAAETLLPHTPILSDIPQADHVAAEYLLRRSVPRAREIRLFAATWYRHNEQLHTLG